MATKMLIDATHTEETRVAVVNNELLEEFDFETSTKKQNKGNIYLAKVTRVEPSLQAAFVDYGGDRQGFLAFSEIHPDYYQIPIDDRRTQTPEQKREIEPNSEVDNEFEDADDGQDKDAPSFAEEADSGEIKRPTAPTKYYRIQEVIKRRQILLVQVNKEERGTKGAALTTYISLPGRYCVLMPNTSRGGGVSRKIESLEARKRLRSLVSDLNVPEGMAIIVRTAGQERTKSEIKRDFDYLLRLWETIRDSTLKSIAPALIYEEANLIKRSIRDLYRSNFDGILVQGEDGYRIAKSFMRMMMPSRAKLVQPYREEVSLFHQYKIEDQLDLMHSPRVSLPSGGYLVINATEALVAIDVNSGRATREWSIEETALKTNLESAEEIARQLKLRDLAGLVVIDFIDMEEMKNNRSVERRLKESFEPDRARIQMGRISPFGLLEFSRQRLRPSLLEVSSHTCPHCLGNGRVRSSESLVMQALRVLEHEGLNGCKGKISVSLPTEAAMYLLNNKRHSLQHLESRYGMQVLVVEEKEPGPVEVKVGQATMDGSPTSDGNTSVVDRKPNGGAARSLEDQARNRHSSVAPSQKESPKTIVPEPTEGIESDKPSGADSSKKQAEGTRGRPRRRGRRGGKRRSPRSQDTESVHTDKTGKSDDSNTNVANAVASEETRQESDPNAVSQAPSAGGENESSSASNNLKNGQKNTAEEGKGQHVTRGRIGARGKKRSVSNKVKETSVDSQDSLSADQDVAPTSPKISPRSQIAKVSEKGGDEPRQSKRRTGGSRKRVSNAKKQMNALDTETDTKGASKEDSSISAHTDIKSGDAPSTGSSEGAVFPKEKRPAATSDAINDNEEKGSRARVSKIGKKSPLRKMEEVISSGEQESSRAAPASLPENRVKNEDEPTPIQARRRGWWRRISS